MIKNSAEAIYRLIDLGVEFANEKGELKLAQEGGHNKRRIAYVGDYTGREIERILVKRVKEHPNITILEDTFALDLIIQKKACFGCIVIIKGKIMPIFADQTIMATGGVGQLFGNTTNPKISTGDGIAMGVRAGLKVKDLEFIQFHPTAFAKKITPRFLISETVRGEGAKIVNKKCERVVKNALAPRDIVAREIYLAGKKGPVYLDIRHKNANYLKKRFPQIYEKLKKYGYDMAKDLIPVTPAAHYICGGIVTDLNGRTGIKNLFAFGEVACTGVHGANRLASNSLLEALVFSNQITQKLKISKDKNKPKVKVPKVGKISSKNSRNQIQEIMWQYGGIVRDINKIKKEGLPRLLKITKQLNKIKGTNHELAETRNMTLVGILILKAASERKKSLGCHFAT